MSTMKRLGDHKILTTRIRAAVEAALERGGGLLRLAPTWVPRDFLQPGHRLKLDRRDIYAYGAERGIDERWLCSPVEAANPGREPDEGLSYVVLGRQRATFRDAVEACGESLLGAPLWQEYGRWPAFAKLFDNEGPIPLHMHQNDAQAKLVGMQGKPEAYYFPPQLNQHRGAFPHTFFGLLPGVAKADVKACLERWNSGDNGILRLSKAYALEPGTGWLVGPGILHAPGSLCAFEPQWGSDVAGMFQNVVEQRFIGREMLVANVPEDRKDDLDFIVDQLDWEANLDSRFKQRCFLDPLPDARAPSDGCIDRWVVYGAIDGEKRFSAKELTVDPGARCRISDPGAYGLLCVQGHGAINGQPLSSPTLIRFGELTDDEYFCPYATAREGVAFENRSATEPLVCLRYFGPDASAAAPDHPFAEEQIQNSNTK